VSTLYEVPWIVGLPNRLGGVFFFFLVRPDSSPENSDSDTSDSDDPSVIEEFNPVKMRELLDSIDDEDDEGGGGGSGARLATVHEVLNEDVAVPGIVEVDPKETLERVGEIHSVLQDKIVIVKGLAHQVAGRASDRVLDIETLLVFEDRKVLGYVSSSCRLLHSLSLTPLSRDRFTRHSGQRTNLFTKFDLTTSFLWTRNERKSRVQSFTFRVEVTSCSLISSGWERAATRATRTTRSLVKMR